MELQLRNKIQVSMTPVANEFIDQYMAAANGEYVKVYLFLMRHESDTVTIPVIADALNHTEADVKRALAYWEKVGVLVRSDQPAAERQPAVSGKQPGRPETSRADLGEQRPAADKVITPVAAFSCPQEQMSLLSRDDDFTQLLYIAQKYLNKVFTSRDCEVFGYLYGSLHMSSELLEYLVEYCAQSGHTTLRYIETVALNWHERKLLTVEEAKAYTSAYTKDSFAVMKAFGLTGRKPGEAEVSFIERWFKSYGFTKELVVEACNRTLAAAHSPSFQYADKILSEWKQAGVKQMADLEEIDRKRQQEHSEKGKQGQPKTARSGNRFHNFEQSSYDYDEMVWSMWKEQ